MAAMTQSELDAFLSADRHAVLATNRVDGPPQLTPVWYLYAEGRIFVSAVAGTAKVRNLRRDPNMTICVDGCRGDNRYVVLSGKARLVEPGTEEQLSMRRRIIRKYHASDAEAEAYYARIEGSPAALIVLEPSTIISSSGA